MPDLEYMAAQLAAAARDATAIAQFSATAPYSLADAYAVQTKLVSLRPGPRVGIKMGFTSRAKMEQMGVSDLIFGELTQDMRIPDGGSLFLDRFVHPRVEPEIAFLLKKPLTGPVSPTEAARAIEAVAVAAEVIDSRYENFAFSLEDVVADNASSSAFAVGPWMAPGAALDNLGMSLSFDGRPVQLGSSAAILGDPLRALIEGVRLSEQYGRRLEAGSILLAGAATAAVPLRAGAGVQAEAAGLGRVSFRVETS